MNLAQWIIVAIVIICAIAFLFSWHYRTWRARRAEAITDNERRFHDLQCRRRMHSTGIMGVIAVMAFFGQVYRIPGWIGILYWGSAFFLTTWLIFMAFGDFAATRLQVVRSQQSLLMERAKLQRELNEIRQKKGSEGPEE